MTGVPPPISGEEAAINEVFREERRRRKAQPKFGGTSLPLDQQPEEGGVFPGGIFGTAAQEAREATNIEEVFREERARRADNLRQTIAFSLQSDPDFVAEAQRIGLELDASPQLIERDLEGYRKVLQRVQLNRWQESERNPILRQQMLDPVFARMAYDDMPSLGALEGLGTSFDIGQFKSEFGILESRRRDQGGLSKEDEARAGAIGRYLETVRQPGGFFRTPFEFLGQMAVGAPHVAEMALAGGLAGGGAAFVGGGEIPFIGAVTVPAAAFAGAASGAITGLWQTSYRIEGGHLYAQMLRDGIDQDTAAWASRIGGAASATIEVAGAGLAGRGLGISVKAVRESFFRQVAQKTSQALTRPTLGRAAGDFAKGFLATYLGETGTEVAQDVTNAISEDLARLEDGRPTRLATPEGRAELASQLGDTIATMAEGMLLLSLVPAAGRFVSDARRVQRADVALDVRAKLFKAMGETKLGKRSPAALDAYTGRVLEGSGAENTYVDAQDFADALQQTGKSREQLAEELPGVVEQLDGALQTGGDVVIPTSTYGARVEGTELGNLLGEKVRIGDPDSYSQEAIAAAKTELKAGVEEAVEATERAVTRNEELRAVEEDFERQVREANQRIPKKAARNAAAALRAFVETNAPADVSPREFAQQVVSGVVQGEGVAGATQLRQDALDVPDWLSLRSELAARWQAGEVSDQQVVDELLEPFREGTDIRVGEVLEEASDGTRRLELQPIGASVDASSMTHREAFALAREAAIEELVEAREDARTSADILRQETPEKVSNAAFDPKTHAIVLFEGADLTSILHELGHAFLHWMGNAAATVEVPAEGFAPNPFNPMERIRANFEAFLEWRGIEGGVEAWNAMGLEEQRPHHEAFAESFEVYTFTGKAPSEALKRVFHAFRRMIGNLWRGLRGQVKELDPVIRGIFDRMLASDDAIAHAQAVRGLKPLFEEKPDGMSDAAWARVQQARDDAIDEAVAKVERRSLRTLQWLREQLASGKTLRELQARHKELREKTKAAVREEVEAEPVYRVLEFIRTGKLTTEEGTVVEVEGTHKLRTDAVRELVPEGTDLVKLRVTSPEGLAPDAVADMFGFSAGQALVVALVEARSQTIEEVVEERTDQRMTEEHSNLTDTAAVQQAVDEALHNPARSRFLAAQFKAVSGSLHPMRLLVKAARELAQEALAEMPVAQIKAWRFQGAEARANRQAERAMAKGNTAEALVAQLAEMRQHEMAREAAKVEKEVAKVEAKTFRQFFPRSDKNLVKTHDIDLVLPGRVLLRAVQFRPPVEGQPARQETEAIEKLREDQQSTYTNLVGLADEVRGSHYRQLTLEQFRDVVDVVDSLWSLSLSENFLEIEGQRLEKAAIVGEHVAQIGEQQARVAPGAQPPEGRTPNPAERFIQKGWHVLASLKKFQHWARFMDLNDPNGPFQKYMLRPMFRAIDGYRTEWNAIAGRLASRVAKLEKLYGSRWDDWIDAPELNYVSTRTGQLVQVRIRGVRQLADIILDIGNLSNKAKRFVGEGWSPRPQDTGGVLDTSKWDAFFAANLQTEENPNGLIGPELMEFASAVWAEFEVLRPRAQSIYKKLFGLEFPELEIQDVELPWGTIKGGYAPVRVDQDRAKNPRRPPDVEASVQGMEDDFKYSNMAIGTGRDFTKERNPNAYDALSMDIGRRFQGFGEELRFIHLQPQVRNVLRLTQDRTFEEAMNAYDRDAIVRIIHPWLDNTARQTVNRPSKSELADKVSKFVQAGTSVGYLGFRLALGVVQLSGLQLARELVGHKFMWSGLGHFLSNPKKAWDEAAGKHVRMEERLNTHVRRIEDALRNQSLDRGWRTWAEFRQSGGRFAMFLIRMFQGTADVITWHGAYQQAWANAPADADMATTERRAVEEATQAVELSQGGGGPESAAGIDANTPFMQLFFQFLKFGNVLLNQSLTRMASKQSADQTPIGRVRNVMRRMGAFAYLPLMLAFWETVIRQSLEGPPDDEDDDGYLDEFAATYAKNLFRNSAGMLPIVGPGIAALAGGDTNRMAASPASSFFGEVWAGAMDAMQGDFDDKTAIGTMLTFITGWPLRSVGQTADFLEDVESGEVRPVGPLDLIRGIATGRASEASER